MQNIKEYVANRKLVLKEELKETNLRAVIVQVGNVEASNRYVRNKIKDLEEVGIKTELLHFDEHISEEALLLAIKGLNNDEFVTGYLVQLPLPKHISEEKVNLAIDPTKDLDGFHPLSKTVAATPLGVYNYLKAMKSGLITYDHPKLESILSSTYGIFVYQEEIMFAVRELAGFSAGQSDTVRKAMGLFWPSYYGNIVA